MPIEQNVMKATLNVNVGVTLLLLSVGFGCATQNDQLSYPLRMPTLVRDLQPSPAGFQFGTGVVRSVRGEVMVSEPGKEWREVKVGTILGLGAAVWTGADSRVDVYLGDNGPVIRVTSDSVLVINSLAYNKTGHDTVIDTQFFLQRGRLLGNVKKMAPNSRYEVRIPKGILKVRGTDFNLSADGGLAVPTGEVSYDFEGRNYVLKTAEMFDPKSGKISKIKVVDDSITCPPYNPPPNPFRPPWPQRKF